MEKQSFAICYAFELGRRLSRRKKWGYIFYHYLSNLLSQGVGKFASCLEQNFITHYDGISPFVPHFTHLPQIGSFATFFLQNNGAR